MDNLCHTLVGAALAEAGLKRRTRFAWAALLISANLPDLDVLVFLTSTPAVEFRRGWTHGILAQLTLPIALAALLWLIGRRLMRGTSLTRVRIGWLLVLSYIGVYSHVFLDYLNNYGIRLLAPFDWRWFYGDAVFIVDPILWIVLGLGVWLSRRKRSEPIAVWALATAGVYVLTMLTTARLERNLVAAMWTEARGFRPAALMVGPKIWPPWSRDVVIDAGDHYETGTFTWPSSLDLLAARIPKNDTRPEVQIARDAPQIRPFLVWSRFPFWTLEPSSRGTRVTVGDVRFMLGGRMFTASTLVKAVRVRSP